MSKNVLIAPSLDARLSDILSQVSGVERIENSAPTGLKRLASETIASINVGDISGSNTVFIVRSVLQKSINGAFKTQFGERQLPITAPVDGTYYLHSIFGPQHNDSYGAMPSADARLAAAKRNAPPESIAELRNATYNYGFYAVTDFEGELSGLDAFSSFFNAYSEHKEVILKWLHDNRKEDGHFSMRDLSGLITREQERLSETKCTIVPYDGQRLG